MCFPNLGGCPGGLEFSGTKILAQFKNYVFLYLVMMYPQCAREFNFSSSYREFELSGVRVIGIILYIYAQIHTHARTHTNIPKHTHPYGHVEPNTLYFLFLNGNLNEYIFDSSLDIKITKGGCYTLYFNVDYKKKLQT